MISAFVLDRQFGLDQGFEEYDDDLSGAPKQKMFMFKELELMEQLDKKQHADMDQESRRKLSALGYTWDDPAPADGPLPDPKDRLIFWERFQTAQNLIRQKSYEQAVALITALLRDDPDNLIAKSSLANALTHMGEADRALELYQELADSRAGSTKRRRCSGVSGFSREKPSSLASLA